MSDTRIEDVLLLIPVFNDWQAVSRLLPALDDQLAGRRTVRVILVDDASTQPRPVDMAAPLKNIHTLEVLRLRRNLGHQRALAIGLAYAEAKAPGTAVVVMDGDGEDRPEDVPRLLVELERDGGPCIVFAERRKRSESMLFRLGYRAYRFLHHVLTGVPVRVGNFSAVPRECLGSLTADSELWNHYAAAVIKSRLCYRMIPTVRGRRLDGRTSMSLISLVTHGLSAISVFRERVGVRLLIATGVFAALMVLLMAVTVLVRLSTDWAVPGWSTYTIGLLLLLLLQTLFVSLLATFAVLGGRDAAGFIPSRDYVYFVRDCEVIYSRG